MNIIELVLDCASYNRIIDSDNHQSPMPFLLRLKEQGMWCTNCYAQGPYTESALMGLTLGKDTMDDNGYFSSYWDWSKSIFSQFQEAGYDVFVTYSYSVMPKEVRTHCAYTDSSNYCKPFFSRFIKSKLDHYDELFNKSGLTEDDYLIVSDLLSGIFDVMLMYDTAETLANDCTISAFEKRTESELCLISDWRAKVGQERDAFKQAQKTYIDNLFKTYNRHFLTRECDLFSSPIKESVKENRDWIKNQTGFFRGLYWRKMRHYLFPNRANRISQRKWFRALLGNGEERAKGSEYYKRLLKSVLIYNRDKMVSNQIDQLLPCARNDVDAFLGWLKNRSHKQAPFYAYIHVDDYHGNTTLCSYDSSDKALLRKEMERSKNYVKSLKRGYEGDIVKDLSLYYLDGCIEHLYASLQNSNLLEDTVLVITADHGSSNTGGMFRYTNTNNFYDEQYHTVLLMTGINKGMVNENYIIGKDIAKTVLSLAGVNCASSFNGISAVSDETRQYAYVEYMGSGVPDLIRKPISFQYRDHKISYVLNIKLFDEPENVEVKEYYDLVTDPDEINNLRDAHKDEKEQLMVPFAPRLNELRLNYKEYLDALRQRNDINPR